MTPSNVSTSWATSCWIAAAVFFPRRRRRWLLLFLCFFCYGAPAADLFVDFDKGATQLLKLAVLADLPLRLAAGLGGGQRPRHGLAQDFVGDLRIALVPGVRARAQWQAGLPQRLVGEEIDPRRRSPKPASCCNNSARRCSNAGREVSWEVFRDVSIGFGFFLKAYNTLRETRPQYALNPSARLCRALVANRSLDTFAKIVYAEDDGPKSARHCGTSACLASKRRRFVGSFA